MKNSLSILIIALSFLSVGCMNNSNNRNTNLEDSLNNNLSSGDSLLSDGHTSQSSIDWAGIYQDTIPCADCPGILTTIKLYEDGKYSYIGEYLDRDTSVQDTGKFMWHNNGSVVHLKGKNLDSKYKVGENVLIQTDKDGNLIEGVDTENFSLHKVF